MAVTNELLNEFSSYLRKDKYKNKIQDLRLEHCTDNDGDYIYLVLIKIKPSQRDKGYGSAVMYDMCKLADEHNVRIKLYATNIYGAELKRLYGFYSKHDFVLIKKIHDGEMLYYPKKVKKKRNLLKTATYNQV